ncbi:YdcF family protein [Rhizobium wenxiniae]|uniref:YdcF family protein n=1 Tax=Rhizobium wenxiniae TaxID=1737357 RepID=UPI001C6F5913|nr:YdcF family protein [Rhizobium wenxiniae]MBW9090680.1 YdcF family protein [Rhizobium wenxiniae]
MKRLIALIFAPFLLLAASASAIVIDGLNDRVEKADVGVVLGSMVMPDGTPSPRLQARLDRAVELHGQGIIDFILVSGGTGKEGFSEGKVMRDYLVAQNIAEDRIITDEFGNTTRDTAINAAGLMKERSLSSAIAISQYFHLTRSRMAFRDAGIAQVGTAHARYFEGRDLYSIAREIPALAKYWLAG